MLCIIQSIVECSFRTWSQIMRQTGDPLSLIPSQGIHSNISRGSGDQKSRPHIARRAYRPRKACWLFAARRSASKSLADGAERSGSRVAQRRSPMPVSEKATRQELDVSHTTCLSLLFCIAQHACRDGHCVNPVAVMGGCRARTRLCQSPSPGRIAQAAGSESSGSQRLRPGYPDTSAYPYRRIEPGRRSRLRDGRARGTAWMVRVFFYLSRPFAGPKHI